MAGKAYYSPNKVFTVFLSILSKNHHIFKDVPESRDGFKWQFTIHEYCDIPWSEKHQPKSLSLEVNITITPHVFWCDPTDPGYQYPYTFQVESLVKESDLEHQIVDVFVHDVQSRYINSLQDVQSCLIMLRNSVLKVLDKESSLYKTWKKLEIKNSPYEPYNEVLKID